MYLERSIDHKQTVCYSKYQWAADRRKEGLSLENRKNESRVCEQNQIFREIKNSQVSKKSMDTSLRSRTRINYSAHALIKSGTKGVIKGVVRDVSIDSIYLSCQPRLIVNDEVSLEIVLLGDESELIIKVLARVKRIDQYGIALCFHKPLEWWPVFSQFPFHQVER